MDQHLDKLVGVHPQLQDDVRRLLLAMGALGFTMIVTDGVRTAAEQAARYAQGRTAPGNIVTNADGYNKKSNHQLHADGLGHAVDLTFVDGNGQPSWAPTFPWLLYGAMARALGLMWGGDWTSIKDLPHVELKDAP